MRRLALACLLAVPFLSVPATATAPSLALAQGVGKDLVPVANIPYANGTDLEFATVNGHDYAIAAAMGSGLRIINIDDPENPVQTGFLGCRGSQNDVQVRGSLVLLGMDDASPSNAPCFTQLGIPGQVGVLVISIANPASPQSIGFVQVPQRVHNVTWHPGGRYAYTSDSALLPYMFPPGGQLQIVDLLDPTNPAHVGSYTLLGDRMSTHDITFNTSGSRAYVAALNETYILDTTNPAAPREIARIEDPAINISHGADPTPDGRYLLISDEQAGATANR